jgi:hypothetical protein
VRVNPTTQHMDCNLANFYVLFLNRSTIAKITESCTDSYVWNESSSKLTYKHSYEGFVV